MMRYIIDLDGVISKKEDWSFTDSYERQEKMLMSIKPNIDVIRKINLLSKENTIIIFTSRIWHDYKTTKRWLKKHGVKYDELIMAKPLGDYYVDDKNLSVEEFLK